MESDDVVVNLTAFETVFPERLFSWRTRSLQHDAAQPAAGASPAGISSRQTSSTSWRADHVAQRRCARVDVPDGLSIPGAEPGRPTDLLGAAEVTGQKDLCYGLLGAMEDDAVLVARVPG